MVHFFFPDKNLIQPDYAEISRYLGYSKKNLPDEIIFEVIKECGKMLHEALLPKSCFCEFDIHSYDEENAIKIFDFTVYSKDLKEYFKDCEKTYLFAATIGAQVDLLIRKMQIIDSVKASVLQATGAMYIEKYVNMLNEEIKKIATKNNQTCKPRFSPGFGDASLMIQKDFFRLLPCNKLGLTLMDTLIMAPEKSVTGFIAIKKN